MDKVCKKCGKLLKEMSFYDTKNFIRYPDEKLDICKACINEDLVLEDPNTYLTVLEECDVPFLEDEWNALKEKYPNLNILGRYMARMKLCNFRDLRWRDGEYEKLQPGHIPQEVQHSVREWVSRQKGHPYPCSNQAVGNYIILSSSNRINRFEELYPWMVRFSSSRMESRYINPKTEDKWRSIIASSHARGYRFHRAIIDSSIDYDIFQTIIEPCMYSYCTFVDFFD